MSLNTTEKTAAASAPTLAIFCAGVILSIITLDGQALAFALTVWVVSLPWQLLAIPLFLWLYHEFKNQSMPRGLATLLATGVCTLLQAAATYLLVGNELVFAVLLFGPLSGICFALLNIRSEPGPPAYSSFHQGA